MSERDQRHPREEEDSTVVQRLLEGEQTDHNLAELARLRIRYQGFPGARKLQAQLDKILEKWQMTEADLFEKTRQIHAQAQVYRGVGAKRNDDWS